MTGSGTIKTLVALLVAMTIGAVVLMQLETEPIRPSLTSLAVVAPPPAGAGKVVFETDVFLRAGQWKHVVVHASARPDAGLASQCHFVVAYSAADGATVSAGPLWQRQTAGHHTGGLWDAQGIGICLVGDFSRQGPPEAQFAALIDLVHTVQETCGISAGRVYLHSDLVANSPSPGASFPARRFASELLQGPR